MIHMIAPWLVSFAIPRWLGLNLFLGSSLVFVFFSPV